MESRLWVLHPLACDPGGSCDLLDLSFNICKTGTVTEGLLSWQAQQGHLCPCLCPLAVQESLKINTRVLSEVGGVAWGSVSPGR